MFQPNPCSSREWTANWLRESGRQEYTWIGQLRLKYYGCPGRDALQYRHEQQIGAGHTGFIWCREDGGSVFLRKVEMQPNKPKETPPRTIFLPFMDLAFIDFKYQANFSRKGNF